MSNVERSAWKRAKNKEHLILISGGARSGKSRFAEQLAAEKAKQRENAAVLYLATCEVRDEEIKQRIEIHQTRRPSSWLTVEEPLHTDRKVREYGDRYPVILLDCITLWVSNYLLSKSDDTWHQPSILDELLGKTDQMIEAARRTNTILIAVTNEVGLGIVPDTPLGRVYRDYAGLVNQRLAEAADQAYLVAMGIPVSLKDLDARKSL